jgi:murein DD-endopeptidase MepM/ murein hydrolase activator NlpD
MSLENLLTQNLEAFTPLFTPPLARSSCVSMDLSSSSREFTGLGEAELDRAILQKLADADALAGVGGYLENRSLYRDTDLFQGDAERCIHIGVDVFMAAGTMLHAPLDGEVHSFANRQVWGDYGPVIILRHELDGVEFHTLYGHLAETSLVGLHDGKAIRAGAAFARIGARPTNGNWPPHLHFQVIADMQGKRGDYPGVVRRDEVEFYRQNCPDPTCLLLTPEA